MRELQISIPLTITDNRNKAMDDSELIDAAGPLAKLSAKVDTLEIALVVVLAKQSPGERKQFLEDFSAEVQRRESTNRHTADPATWTERLGPHATRLKSLLPR